MDKNMGIITKKNILVFPCGTEIGLEINRALANDIHFELFGASSLPDHGQYVYKNYIENIPFVDKKDFINAINKICTQYHINFIIPAHDSAVLKFAQNLDKLFAKIITSPIETCEIARSKQKTYDKLKNIILCPKIYTINDRMDFPVFIKPDVGQGSKGAKKCENQKELDIEFANNPNIIISELLTGEEYTIDCFTNKNGKLLFAGGRKRSRISNGISVNSYPVYDAEFKEIAEKINSAIKFRGMWFFQLKRNAQGQLVLLEIAPRIAGTMGMYRALGINFILLALYDAMGFELSIINNNFDIEIDRALFSRFKHNINYNHVYIDFDDTLFIQHKVNTNMMKFIYQERNNKKKIYLITKHENDVKETLKTCCIDKNLFEQIIQIKEYQNKADYIQHKDAIFIDDSYTERKMVLEKLRIPVFGIDAIEVLMDYKK